ncbi:MAG: leucine-rich repeat protein, partial [Bacteroidales bacterium]|nr:leucine-rich repeat protein [Bacteroidales bacterium]MDY6394763.1 leucine-rich repeat protein [Bacteroidales bacterium]MDY6395927.1 leucine-rich repeat protein [Bacteroidales bacterium]MDY6403568.1 leucine-rich repeat protein [Bacteroidales bacterium]MDY6424187.1 leucine-rich repeat protein [Bacteroidales bacterium]
MRKISFFLVGVFLLLLSGNLLAQSPAQGEEGYQWEDPEISGVLYTITSTSPAEVSVTITEDFSKVDFIPTTVEDDGTTYDVVEIESISWVTRYLVVPESIRKVDFDLNQLRAIKFECTNMPDASDYTILDSYNKKVISVPAGRTDHYAQALDDLKYEYDDGVLNYIFIEGGVPYTEDGSGLAFLWRNNTSASVALANPDLTEAIIPQTITGLGTDLTEEYTVTTIQQNAFEVSFLKRAVLPESIRLIEGGAFYDCDYLEYINIPADCYLEIGGGCFEEMITDTLYWEATMGYAGDESAFINTRVKNLIIGSNTTQSVVNMMMEYDNALMVDTITIEGSFTKSALMDINTEDEFSYLRAIVLKNNAYFKGPSYSDAQTYWSGIPMYIEKELPIDEFSLIGNIGGATNYNFIASNAGDNSGFAHSMVALPFCYANNSWGVDANGNGAINGTNTPVSYGESFFVYPTTNQYNTNGTTINGDTYTTLRQEIPYSNLKRDDFTVSLTNSSNSTNWFALSNPFIGRLNLSNFYTSNSDALQSIHAYVWDNTAHDWLALEDISTTNEYALYPATGFLVEGANDNANPTFNFKVTDIVTTETITTTKSAQANRIEFTATSNDVEMKMYAHIDDVSSNGFGRMDASVLCSSKEDAVNPYMQVEGHNLLDNYFSELPAT